MATKLCAVFIVVVALIALPRRAGAQSVNGLWDATVLVNRATEVGHGTAISEVRPPEALIYIRQADYDTTYTVTINGNPYSYATASTSRATIATDFIAEELLGVLEDAGLDDDYTIVRYGSTIHITRIDEAA
jgi:hypothetical protein